ncbi:MULTISPECIES: hypothetical protein [Bradyrhizobium]|uniref:Uncharacterized protein n=1 Tax=Bradyrhizobium frederickii TaxID=2560054 RepID=A0A4Y9L5A1_9BRAD|nr:MULTISPECIES: hypothetical protein [Bradyrhizobium]TFV38730.1 hypothetical protein E4K66_15240 [Bradyrhizobium frederickii]
MAMILSLGRKAVIAGLRGLYRRLCRTASERRDDITGFAAGGTAGSGHELPRFHRDEPNLKPPFRLWFGLPAYAPSIEAQT